MKKLVLILCSTLLYINAESQTLNTVKITDWNTIQKSGFFESDAAISTNLPAPSTTHSWYWGLNIAHANNYFGGQIAFGINYQDAGVPSMYIRSTTQSGNGEWAKVIHNKGDQKINGRLTIGGTDLFIESSREGGGRALVHDYENKLVVNYEGDFNGGVDVHGSLLNVRGNLNTSGQLNVRSGKIFLSNTPGTGWRTSYLEYGGHSLIIGSKEGAYMNNTLDLKPGGASEGIINTVLNMHIANSIGNHTRKVSINTTGASFFNGGNIGIGIENPQHKLDVNGIINTNDKVQARGLFLTGADLQIKCAERGNNGQGRALVHNGDNSLTINYGGDFAGGVIVEGSHLSVLERISIGTKTPSSEYRLDVKGAIRAEKIKIEIANGADFVFDGNYNLPSLNEVESYIKENKHLPEIPSEKQMQEEGLNINEFQIKLLQKVEELTLYVIQQDKEKQEQGKQIEKLQKRLEDLENK